jgi:hypothetical protein
MAFPQIATASEGNSGGTASSLTVTLPTGIASGDLIVVEVSIDGTTAATWPSGWTQLYAANTGPVARIEVRYRVADGTEGSSISVTTASTESTYIARRITGHNSAIEAAGTPNTSAGSTTPDPPSFTPSWTQGDTLWIAACTYRSFGGGNGLTAYPSNYSLSQLDHDVGATAGGYGVGGGSAARELNAVTENPGTFTQSLGEGWVANTYAIEASAGAPIALDASLSASAAVTASLTTAIALQAAPAGSATVAAELTTAIRLSSSVSATAAVSAALALDPRTTLGTFDRRLRALAWFDGLPIESWFADDLVRVAVDNAIRLDAELTATAAAAGQLTTAIRAAAAVTATASVNAALTTAIRLAATATATATASAALTTAIRLSAAASGPGTVAAALTTAIRLQATVNATAATSAALTTAIRFTAALNGVTTVAAEFTAPVSTLTASCSAAANVAPVLTTHIRMSCVLTSTGDAAAQLSTAIRLIALLDAMVTLGAQLTTGLLPVVDIPAANIVMTASGNRYVAAGVIGRTVVTAASQRRVETGS